MNLPDETVGILLVALAAAIVLLGVVVVLLAVRLGRLRRVYARVVGPGFDDDIFELLSTYRDEVASIREDLSFVHDNSEHLRNLLRATVSRVGMVRYDAFEDMGGAMSFSAAMLDEEGDGFVLSAINGRTETRTYAKPVKSGDSEHNLSPEERSAIETAMAGKQAPTPRRRRRQAS
ncbi:MAG: DUF4446 family protein [Nitriliruptorales bacterium]